MNAIKVYGLGAVVVAMVLVSPAPGYATATGPGAQRAVEGLKRQGDGGMLNKNADKQMKSSEKANPEKAEKSTSSSGDKTKAKGTN